MSRAPALRVRLLQEARAQVPLRLVWNNSECRDWETAEALHVLPSTDALEEEEEQAVLRLYRAQADVVLCSDGAGGLLAFRPGGHW